MPQCPTLTVRVDCLLMGSVLIIPVQTYAWYTSRYTLRYVLFFFRARRGY